VKFHSLSFALGLLFGGLGIFLFRNDSGDREDRKRVEERVQRSGRSPGGRGSERSGASSGDRNPVAGSEGDLLTFLEEGRKRDGNDAQNYLTRLRVFHKIASMGEREVEGMIEEIFTLEEELGDDDLTGIAKGYAFMRWCELNGSEAMEAFTSRESVASVGRRFARQGMVAWTETNPEGALGWVRGHLKEVELEIAALGEGEKMNDRLRAINDRELVEEFLLSYTRVKDESLLALLPELGEEFRTNYAQDRFLEAASEKEKSVEGLLELADLSKKEHVQARRTIISSLAYWDPRAAGKWTEAQEEGEQRDRLMKSVASQWIEKEPEEGANWYEANLNESTRPDGLVHVFENWSRKDSTKAAEWLLKQTDDPSRDLAEAAAARAMAEQGEYREAVSWMNAIEDLETRNENWKALLQSHRNRKTGALPDELVEAAEAAGFDTGP